MERKVDICGGNNGTIWGKKPKPQKIDGFLISISNSNVGLAGQSRHIPFTKIAFSNRGTWFIATDHFGVMYCFDIRKNKYWVVNRLGLACTAVLCSHTHPSQLFVATTDHTVRHVNIYSRQLITSYGPHVASIQSLSLSQTGEYLLVVTAYDSVLWCVNTGKKVRTLCGGENVGIQDVFFLPVTDNILTCFKDDSIHTWETSTLAYNFLLPRPSGPSPHYRAFALTQDGQLLAAGGRSQYLHLWDMRSHTLSQIIQLPPKLKFIKQLQFLPNKLKENTTEVSSVQFFYSA
jgi:WD40 repeat protein